jgi:tRNA threonylcarbamoyladenosine biosynthesis protein TsaB
MLLALDSSTRFAGIALYDDRQGPVVEVNWRAETQHTTALLPRVAQMMADAGVRVTDLEAVAVALGPGSFTGLRVAVAAAKGLALANGLALVGVPTLDVVAFPHRDQSLPVIALVQAGRGRICWARYGHAAEGWRRETPYALSHVAGLVEVLAEPALVTGELSPADRALLAEKLAGKAIMPTPAVALRRAACLAELGWRRFAAGERDDVVALNPIYLQELTAVASKLGAA